MNLYLYTVFIYWTVKKSHLLYYFLTCFECEAVFKGVYLKNIFRYKKTIKMSTTEPEPMDTTPAEDTSQKPGNEKF